MSLDLSLIAVIETEVFAGNITHNLAQMAHQAGIYQVLWRPEEISVNNALEMIPILESGISLLESDPHWYKQYNASNGWGCYDDLLQFAKDTLVACKEHPDARVSASR